MDEEHRERSDPGSSFVVAPAPARDRRRSRVGPVLAVAAVAVVSVLTVAGLVLPSRGGPPAPTDRPGDVAASQSAPAAVEASPTGPTAEASGVAVADASTESAALLALGRAAGWGDCPVWRSLDDAPTIDGAAVARTMAASGVHDGALQVVTAAGDVVPVIVGGDDVAAARSLGGSVVVREPGGTWTGIREASSTFAVRLDATPLPGDGRPVWQVRARAEVAPYCASGEGTGVARAVIVPDSGDAFARFEREAGWDSCRTWQRMLTPSYPSPSVIDGAVDSAGMASDRDVQGWVLVPAYGDDGATELFVWLGSDPAVAAGRMGADLVVMNQEAPASAWLRVAIDGRPAAIFMRVVHTPKGRTAWLPTPNTAGTLGVCGPSTRPDGTVAGGAGTPLARHATVEVLRSEGGGPGGLGLLREELGWTGCRLAGTEGSTSPVDGAAVDRAAAADGVEAGWLGVTPDGRRVWLGDDVVALAAARDEVIVAIDGSPEVWIGDRARVARWAVMTTPAGRFAWQQTGSLLWPDGCVPDPAAAAPVGLRSFTCWTDRDRCLDAVESARRVAPDAFTPATDVAVGLGEACPALTTCPWTGPTQPAIVTAVPVPWRSEDQLRAFAVGSRRLSGVGRELSRDALTEGIVAMASRPAAALPTAGGAGQQDCPASGIEGVLGGGPWDPRVAWIDTSAVRWPTGFTARFTPDLVLVDPAGRLSRAGDTVQASGIGGSGPAFVACQVTRVDARSPLPSSP